MKSSKQLIEEIIRAKTALHLRLVADRNGGKVEVGGRRIDDLIAEVDAGIASYEQTLVLFKNEEAAAVMMAAAQIDAEEDWKAPAEPASVTSRAKVGPEQGKPRSDGKS